MKISLVSNGDLGNYHNLKSDELKAVMKYFLLNDEVSQVICRLSSEKRSIYSSMSFISKSFHFLFWLFDKFTNFKFMISSKYTFKVFDFEASIKLKNSDITYFVPFPFIRTIRKAKANGSVAVVAGTSAVSDYVEKLKKEEYKKILNKNYKLNVNKSFLRSLIEADYIIAYSNFVKSTYLEYGVDEKKIFVCPLGIELDKFNIAKKKDDVFRVLMVADFTILKGLQYVLRAWKKLNLDNAELLLIGDIKDKDLEVIINEYIARDDSIVRVSHTRNIVKYYQNASIFIHPSLTEGFEKVSFEAMACGLPIIVSNHTGASSVISEGKEGFIVPIRDSESIEKHIKYFYDNPKEVIRMGKNSRKLAERYSWDNFSGKIYKIIKTVLRKRERKSKNGIYN
ncbi:MAG: glycosyltransferase [Nanoarchaeota archaeon]|nr:glycosyltransferase [Nanoarchaeota archaeon]